MERKGSKGNVHYNAGVQHLKSLSEFAVFDDLPLGVQVIDPDMRYLYLNPVLLAEVGYSSAEMIGKKMEDVFPGIQESEIYNAIEQCWKTREGRSVLNRFQFPDGRIAYHELKVSRIQEGVIVFSLDATHQKTRELRLQESNRRLQQQASEIEETLRKVLDSSLDGVMYFQSVRSEEGEIQDFKYVFANRAACEIVKKEENELVGRNLLEVLPEHSSIVPEYGRSLFDIYREVVETGQSKSLLFEFNSDDVSGWFSNRSVKLADGFVVTFSVVTEMIKKTRELERLNQSLEEEVERELEKNREQQETLIQQSKLAAMGDMISAIAHQWRQPLNAIGLGLEVMEDITLKYQQSMSDEDRKEFKEVSETVQERITYLSDTIEDFRDFYSPSHVSEIFSLKDVAETSLRFFAGQCKSNGIECFLEEEGNPHLKGNSNQFRQVLLNLMNNAIDALERGPYKKTIRIRAGRNSNGLFLEVHDNAGGVPEEIIHRIFEPYFTTKGPTSGSGNGLYIARMIIEKSFGGTLEVRNEENGACFTIQLPEVKINDRNQP